MKTFLLLVLVWASVFSVSTFASTFFGVGSSSVPVFMVAAFWGRAGFARGVQTLWVGGQSIDFLHVFAVSDLEACLNWLRVRILPMNFVDILPRSMLSPIIKYLSKVVSSKFVFVNC